MGITRSLVVSQAGLPMLPGPIATTFQRLQGFSQSPASLIRHVRLFYCGCNHLDICVCGEGEVSLIFLICFRIFVYFHSARIKVSALLFSLECAAGQRDLSTRPVNLSCQPVTSVPEHGVDSFKFELRWPAASQFITKSISNLNLHCTDSVDIPKTLTPLTLQKLCDLGGYQVTCGTIDGRCSGQRGCTKYTIFEILNFLIESLRSILPWSCRLAVLALPALVCNCNKQLTDLMSRPREKTHFYSGGPRESALKTQNFDYEHACSAARHCNTQQNRHIVVSSWI